MSELTSFTPRLRSTDEVGLHERTPEWRSTDWWACTEPERPSDEDMMIDWRCHHCLMKVRLHIVISGDYPTSGVYDHGAFMISDGLKWAESQLSDA